MLPYQWMKAQCTSTLNWYLFSKCVQQPYQYLEEEVLYYIEKKRWKRKWEMLESREVASFLAPTTNAHMYEHGKRPKKEALRRFSCWREGESLHQHLSSTHIPVNFTILLHRQHILPLRHPFEMGFDNYNQFEPGLSYLAFYR